MLAGAVLFGVGAVLFGLGVGLTAAGRTRHRRDHTWPRWRVAVPAPPPTVRKVPR
jgi:hypothetical protein